MPTKPKAKKKRGIVVTVERQYLYHGAEVSWCCGMICERAQYSVMRRAGLPELKPGESVKVRVVIEEV